jgi:GNAT superfamily N-acetyltransferase
MGYFIIFFNPVKLLPQATRLIAYDAEERKLLVHLHRGDTSTLYSIKYVFVDPEYRKLGIASRLLINAFAIAKEKEQPN